MIKKGVTEAFSQYNPYYILYSLYQNKGEYDKAAEVLDQIKIQYSSLQGIGQWVDAQKQQVLAQKALKASAPKDTARTQTAVK
jgi:hypothetical protein